MLIFLAVVLMLAMAAYDVPPLVRIKQWGELALYVAMWVAGLTLSILQIAQVNIPSPTTLITETMSPLGEALSKLLGLS